MDETAERVRTQGHRSLEERLARIEAQTKEFLQSAKVLMEESPSIYSTDFFVLGALRRLLAVSAGFQSLIRSRNFLCAAPLLRMQIDTGMRVYALSLVERPDRVCDAIFDGKPLNKVKDREGVFLSDAYLVRRLGKQYPWIVEVYKQASGFVHLSERHFYAAIHSTNDVEREVRFRISETDGDRHESEYYDVVDAFFAATKVSGMVICTYLASKARPAEVSAP
ncbi:hypothetical protein [Caulobacter sp. 17J80-11]|uniref:hypothetical protein n=1 Tax=Caulobacter sp. 17J80-11 TaxID=2763502 RepID=UPI001653B1C1|nr:hypothetical protein [Caulobacter sp. 17J80-11]MBC6982871.1 hypothetical protein [Caulobacter sp. 17J80-11]